MLMASIHTGYQGEDGRTYLSYSAKSDMKFPDDGKYRRVLLRGKLAEVEGTEIERGV